ncbi:pantothenate synthetase [Hasllibacter halocynthiae]|uniref:Pantothenate synthetase n=1 Tax=Hasllibacter halocynthiae TaxID=595589 RepID=A0A2T0X136_9RHOB|nr:pantoate--beta-alanine ligase [Hasllibacter halocynthiae]PRY92651.1 pantothenate synthetase [Hasllibacter halocynthiae]
MKIARDLDTLRPLVAGWTAAGARVGLVTTMGALHEGHMALIRAAREGSDRVVATIFVNPTQFGEAADLASYPRREDADLAMLRAAGVDAAWLPTIDHMYPGGPDTFVAVPSLEGILMGATRPGHFRGVATAVAKLLNGVGPHAAWFGEKDFQQLALVRKMVRDLLMPVAIHGVPTVREGDGLALSSRNARLSAADRAAAPVLHRALLAGRAAVERGAAAAAAEGAMARVVASEPRAALASADCRDAATLAPVDGRPASEVVLLLAARFGEVLLIDQMTAEPPTPEEPPS